MKPIDGDGARWARRVIAEDAPIASWRRMFAASTDTMVECSQIGVRVWELDDCMTCSRGAPTELQVKDLQIKTKKQKKIDTPNSPKPKQKNKNQTKPKPKNENQKKTIIDSSETPKTEKERKKGRWTHLVLFGLGLGVSDDESIFFALFGVRFFWFWFGCLRWVSLLYFFVLVWLFCLHSIQISSKYHLHFISISPPDHLHTNHISSHYHGKRRW